VPATAAAGTRSTCSAKSTRVILSVLDAMTRELPRLDRPGQLRLGFWLRTLDFLEHFADQCHHEKEEQLLFLELERAGLPRDFGPTSCMREEHQRGRAGRARMLAAVHSRDPRALASAVRGYVDLLRQHIDKEDQVLFPMAREMLPADAVARLQRGFDDHEHQHMGEETHTRYERMALDLGVEADPAPAG